MRQFIDVGGNLGEVFYCDVNGILVPIDVSALAGGIALESVSGGLLLEDSSRLLVESGTLLSTATDYVWHWDGAAWTFVAVTSLGGVSNDVKDVWTLIPIGDASGVIPTGLWPAPAFLPPGTIQEVSVFGKESSGSIVLDIWADVPANWPPTIADTIVASAKPTIAAAQAAVNVSLSGWTLSTGVGKMFYVNVDSVSTFTLVTIWVRTRRA